MSKREIINCTRLKAQRFSSKSTALECTWRKTGAAAEVDFHGFVILKRSQPEHSLAGFEVFSWTPERFR
jgi:hypothetical protein